MTGQDDYGGQRANMEDASMVGTLACQARVVWPHEREILLRRDGRRPGRVLDVGCGTGEILARLRKEFEPGLLVGVDLCRGHLSRAPRPVVLGDVRHMPFAEDSFDLILVRHLLQAVPDPVALLKGLRPLLAPGGRLHVLAEDYMGLIFDSEDYAVANHFTEVAPAFRLRGTDLYQGRRAVRHLREAGYASIEVEPFVVDNRTADREALAGVFRFWKAGYAATLAELLGIPAEECERRFDAMAAAALDEGRYVAWLLFALSAR